MKTRLLTLTAATLVFSLLLSMLLFPPVFAKGDRKDNRPNVSRSVRAKTEAGNFNTRSNSRASVNNDNSVRINNGSGGNRPSINRRNRDNNNRRNNNRDNNRKDRDKKGNNNDKKVIKKDIDKDVTIEKTEDITINKTVEYVNPPAPPAPQAPAPANNNVNENINENINEVNVTTPEAQVVSTEPQVVYYPEPVYYEVASYQAAAAPTVYPAPKGITTTPQTGPGDFALLSIPGMGGLGFFLRRRFGF